MNTEVGVQYKNTENVSKNTQYENTEMCTSVVQDYCECVKITPTLKCTLRLLFLGD